MIVKLLKDHVYKGVEFKKGSSIVMPRIYAVPLCEQEIAISNEDIPCEKRSRRKAPAKAKKKTTISKKNNEMDLDIDNKL